MEFPVTATEIKLNLLRFFLSLKANLIITATNWIFQQTDLTILLSSPLLVAPTTYISTYYEIYCLYEGIFTLVDMSREKWPEQFSEQLYGSVGWLMKGKLWSLHSPSNLTWHFHFEVMWWVLKSKINCIPYSRRSNI